MTAPSLFVLQPPEPVSLPIHGSQQRFPVRRIFCVGRNYAAHVKEMGGDPRDTPPVFFTKPADAVVPVDERGLASVAYPPGTENLHYEVELVMALQSGGANIPADKAMSTLFGYAVGIDMTRRDVQKAASAKGQPWDMGKAFDQSAPIGPILPAHGKTMDHGNIRLAVDGVPSQDADLSAMIWKLPEIIASLSALVTLAPGDLIFTGTPEGVGPVVRGQKIEASVEGLPAIAFTIS
jgi:fumarylpyruvate hydrolase